MQIKTINDYLEEMYSKYPNVPKEDIRRIVIFGWKSLYLHNSYGGDTFIQDNNTWCYIGSLTSNSLKHFNYYKRKLATKIRILYKRKKIQWDGYYYFALTDKQYDNYLSQKKAKGRPRKHFKFGSVMLYQILDECKISESNKKYIFRIPYITELKHKYYIEDLKTDKAELILERDPLKFKDILVNENDYDFI